MRLTPNSLIARHNFEPPVRGALLELKGSTNSLRVRLTPLRVRRASLRVQLFTAKDYLWVGFGGRTLNETSKNTVFIEKNRPNPKVWGTEAPGNAECADLVFSPSEKV